MLYKIVHFFVKLAKGAGFCLCKSFVTGRLKNRFLPKNMKKLYINCFVPYSVFFCVKSGGLLDRRRFIRYNMVLILPMKGVLL